MRLLWILLPLLAQDAFGQSEFFNVRPEEYQVVRVGQELTLKCELKVDGRCAWRFSPSTGEDKAYLFDSFNPGAQDPSSIAPLEPGSIRNCSVKINSISDSSNGRYRCSPYIMNEERTEGKAAEVVVAKKPENLRFLGAVDDGYPLKVSTSEPTSVQCEVVNARPRAVIDWYLDNAQLHDTIKSNDTPANDPSLWNSVSSLTYQFTKKDYGKSLRCRANHIEYNEQDENQRELSVEVDVQFAAYRSEEGDIGHLYGFTVGQEGEIVVNFTANPRPDTMFWRLGGQVDVSVDSETHDHRFKTGALIERNVARGMYALKLTIDPVVSEDKSKTFALHLDNGIGATELKFQIRTGAAPLPEAVDGGTIGAIVAAVLVLLIIIGVVAFGRSRGKWCFAARQEGEDTSGQGDAETGRRAAADPADNSTAHEQKQAVTVDDSPVAVGVTNATEVPAPTAAEEPAAAEEPRRNGTNGAPAPPPPDTAV